MIKKRPPVVAPDGFVCDICGNVGSDPVALTDCEATPRQKVPLNIGDEVQIFWRNGRHLRRSSVVVSDIQYAGGPHQHIFGSRRTKRLHDAILELTFLPFTQHSKSYIKLAYEDFLLWQEGNPRKLREKRCLPPLTRWQRFKIWLGLATDDGSE